MAEISRDHCIDFLSTGFEHLDQRCDGIAQQISDLVKCAARIEREAANLRTDFTTVAAGYSKIVERLARIERRLDLIEFALTPVANNNEDLNA